MLIESSVILDVVRCRNCDVPSRFRALHRMIENLHFSVFSLASYDGVEALPRFIALRYDFAIIRWTRTLVVAAFQDTFELELFDLNPLITVDEKLTFLIGNHVEVGITFVELLHRQNLPVSQKSRDRAQENDQNFRHDSGNSQVSRRASGLLYFKTSTAAG